MAKRSRRRRGLVRVAHGRGWELLYPAVLWQSMTIEEQQAAIAKQTATIEELIHAHENYPPEADSNLFMHNMHK